MFTLCCCFDQKKMELRLMVISVLLKIKFGHDQISVPKIGLPMSNSFYQPLINSEGICCFPREYTGKLKIHSKYLLSLQYL